MSTPMSISRSFNRPGGFDGGTSWGRDSSLSRMLERGNSGFEYVDFMSCAPMLLCGGP